MGRFFVDQDQWMALKTAEFDTWSGFKALVESKFGLNLVAQRQRFFALKPGPNEQPHEFL